TPPFTVQETTQTICRLVRRGLLPAPHAATTTDALPAATLADTRATPRREGGGRPRPHPRRAGPLTGNDGPARHSASGNPGMAKAREKRGGVHRGRPRLRRPCPACRSVSRGVARSAGPARPEEGPSAVRAEGTEHVVVAHEGVVARDLRPLD